MKLHCWMQKKRGVVEIINHQFCFSFPFPPWQEFSNFVQIVWGIFVFFKSHQKYQLFFTNSDHKNYFFFILGFLEWKKDPQLFDTFLKFLYSVFRSPQFYLFPFFSLTASSFISSKTKIIVNKSHGELFFWNKIWVLGQPE